MAHGRPPDPADPHTRSPTALEQVLIDPKAFICMHRVQRPVFDEGGGTYIDPWPDPGTIHTDSDIYFEASALLEGEQNFILPSADSQQAVTPQIPTFSSLTLVPLPPDTLERDLKPDEGTEPERRDAAQRPACMKPPDYVAEDPDRAGGAQQGSAPAEFGCPPARTCGRNGQRRGAEPAPAHGRSQGQGQVAPARSNSRIQACA